MAAVRIILIIAVGVAATWQLADNWTRVFETVKSLDWGRTVLSFLFVFLGIICGAMGWRAVLRGLGARVVMHRSLPINLVGQLGKYLPGSVWAYLLQMALGRKAGLARSTVLVASLLSVALAMAAALICGAFAIPEIAPALHLSPWMPLAFGIVPVLALMVYPRALAAIVNAGSRVARISPSITPLPPATVATSMLWLFGCYVAYGMHLWILVGQWRTAALSSLSFCIGIMALSMVAGVVGFLLPAGFGAREVVVITGLSPIVGIGPATAYAAVSRLLFVAADLLAAGLAGSVMLRWRHSDAMRPEQAGAPLSQN